jgi:hypothetical protein
MKARENGVSAAAYQYRNIIGGGLAAAAMAKIWQRRIGI